MKLLASLSALLLIVIGVIAAVVIALSLESSDEDEVDHFIELTVGKTEWEVYDGETVEAWTYNGTYPGPEIRVKQGDRVQVIVHNELDEGTTIHWHGQDVPNDQDGVPGITQPSIEPGTSYTYEFVAARIGTTAYHTHQNTPTQLGRGLFGSFIVEPRAGLPWDHDYTLMLHEIDGLYTINGKSFPATLENDLLKIRTGETALVRLINMGSQHHPMHLHGHQFQVLSIDGNTMPGSWFQNTVDVAPGQTVDILIRGTNPGTWTFHCHIIPHVTNRGVYPGGMLTLLDYEDHTSYMEEQAAASDASTDAPAAVEPTEPAESATSGAGQDSDTLKLVARNLAFLEQQLTAPPNTEVSLELDNQDIGVLHNFALYSDSSAEEPIFVGDLFVGIETREELFTTPDPGRYFFRCDVHPSTMTGTFIVAGP